MLVEIDINSGFCPGVTQAVKVAEEILSDGKTLYCLGDIVHNTAEVNRLKEMGLKTINYADFENLNNVSVLIRAHGEPPKTYDIAKKNNIILIDASCPVVLRLQKRIREAVQVGPDDLQVVIFGKKNHAEVNGLVGQAPDKAIVVSNINDLKKLDVRKPIYIFSQTTQSPEKYSEIIDKIKLKAEEILGSSNHIKFLNSICPLMAKREPLIADFATKHDVIVFVSDPKSSNGKMLYGICKKTNPKSYFITKSEDIENSWFIDCKSVGVCGATSTSFRLMKKVADNIKQIF